MKKYVVSFVVILFVMILGGSRAYAGSKTVYYKPYLNNVVEMTVNWDDNTGKGTISHSQVCDMESYSMTSPSTGQLLVAARTFEVYIGSVRYYKSNGDWSIGSSFELPEGGRAEIVGEVTIKIWDTSNHAQAPIRTETKNFSLSVDIPAAPEPKVVSAEFIYTPSSATEKSVNVVLNVGLQNAKTSSASNSVSVSENTSGTLTVSYTGLNG